MQKIQQHPLWFFVDFQRKKVKLEQQQLNRKLVNDLVQKHKVQVQFFLSVFDLGFGCTAYYMLHLAAIYFLARVVADNFLVQICVGVMYYQFAVIVHNKFVGPRTAQLKYNEVTFEAFVEICVVFVGMAQKFISISCLSELNPVKVVRKMAAFQLYVLLAYLLPFRRIVLLLLFLVFAGYLAGCLFKNQGFRKWLAKSFK